MRGLHVPCVTKDVVANRLVLLVVQLGVANANETLQVIALTFIEKIAEHFANLECVGTSLLYTKDWCGTYLAGIEEMEISKSEVVARL